MTKQEFDAIVKDSVDGGNTRADAEAYVIAGHKIETDDKGKPVFGGDAEAGHGSGKGLTKLTRDELLAEAANVAADVTPDMNKKQLIQAIKAAA